ncbi:hypothetical protein EVAR_18225_1 [Eumeta japonica]|uniref:Uncharacterized protein n=1 Tax=Eumeta variegata TaxID=151549 RepID=A0A4C1UJI4_EUMVA|nr:hypothetical protein EVAR_18225_1 [Eumeta japonica]
MTKVHYCTFNVHRVVGGLGGASLGESDNPGALQSYPLSHLDDVLHQHETHPLVLSNQYSICWMRIRGGEADSRINAGVRASTWFPSIRSHRSSEWWKGTMDSAVAKKKIFHSPLKVESDRMPGRVPIPASARAPVKVKQTLPNNYAARSVTGGRLFHADTLTLWAKDDLFSDLLLLAVPDPQTRQRGWINVQARH